MRTSISFLLASLLIAGLTFSGCSKKLGGGLDGDTQTVVTEGWIDDNTFRTTAMGVPKATETNKTKRKIQSKEAAILMAQKTVLEKFKGARLQGASGAADGELTGIAIAKEFGGMVKGGSVIKVSWNKQDQSCEVVYEVKARNLKKRVMFGVQ